LVPLTTPGLTAEPKEGEGCLGLAAGSTEEGGLSTTAAGLVNSEINSFLSSRVDRSK